MRPCTLNLFLRNFIYILLPILISLVILNGASAEEGSDESEIRFGKAYESIGTFDGWTFWVGWDAAFSETYEPKSETYAWVIYFAPEAVYVALQNSKSVYSNVDVNAGFDYFYGVLFSPDGDHVTKSYIDSLLGVTLQVNTFDTSMAPVGPLSQLSVALTSGQTLFRVGDVTNLQRAIQYSTGMNTSFSLMPISIPAGVSLEYESQVAAGFYPIVIWNLNKNAEGNPNDEIIKGFEKLAESDDSTYAGIYSRQMAQQLLPFMKTIPTSQEVSDFIQNKPNNRIHTLISEAEQWLQTGETSELPENLKPQIDPKDIRKLMKPIQSATNCGFEVGYKRGYDASGRDDTIYADCVETITGEVREPVRIVLTSEEISGLVEGSKPSDFEGVDVIFDTSPETYLTSKSTEKTVKIKDGKAVYEIIQNFDLPLIIGVRVAKCKATGNKNLELCRRVILFK